MFLHFMYSMFYEECFNQLLNWLFNLKAWVVGVFFLYILNRKYSDIWRLFNSAQTFTNK